MSDNAIAYVSTINNIIDVIPNGYEKLKVDLQRLQQLTDEPVSDDKELYCLWLRTSRLLQQYIPNPKHDWEYEALSIFSAYDIEDLKRYID